MSPKKKNEVSTFTLKNVDITDVVKIYGLDDTGSAADGGGAAEPYVSTTSVYDLSLGRPPKAITYVDEIKNPHECLVCMLDGDGNTFLDRLDEFKQRSCFWCRHRFSTMPLGCPVVKQPIEVVRQYRSQFTKDVYRIKDRISRARYGAISAPSADTSLYFAHHDRGSEMYLVSGSSLDAKPSYHTDGIFCSFNCCRAYILDNQSSTLYHHSDTLLARMYTDVTGQVLAHPITPAPSWRLLSEYGGYLSIEDFRRGFHTVSHTFHGIVKQVPMGYMDEHSTVFI
jgi:hypothetical protein